ncbi:MAG: hypothetical protein DRI36_06720 [Caldiserica bacterium]|nr:MAG: hypothetical protein DRI36_06720 [Caldisericota bacterium]
MIGILIFAHGRIASSYKKEIERMIGEQEEFYAIDLSEGCNLCEIKKNLEVLTSEKEFIIFVDFLGGTPCNLSLNVFKGNNKLRIITGFNFAMLLSACIRRKEKSIDEVVEIAINEAKRSIKNIKEVLNDKGCKS